MRPTTSRPNSVVTPSSSIQPARIGSMRFCQSASPYGCRVGKSLMSSVVVPKRAVCAICPAARNRSAMPRWSKISIVREWNPPAREPTSFDVDRRSMIDTSIQPGRARRPASCRSAHCPLRSHRSSQTLLGVGADRHRTPPYGLCGRGSTSRGRRERRGRRSRCSRIAADAGVSLGLVRRMSVPNRRAS